MYFMLIGERTGSAVGSRVIQYTASTCVLENQEHKCPIFQSWKHYYFLLLLPWLWVNATRLNEAQEILNVFFFSVSSASFLHLSTSTFMNFLLLEQLFSLQHLWPGFNLSFHQFLNDVQFSVLLLLCHFFTTILCLASLQCLMVQNIFLTFSWSLSFMMIFGQTIALAVSC